MWPFNRVLPVPSIFARHAVQWEIYRQVFDIFVCSWNCWVKEMLQQGHREWVVWRVSLCLRTGQNYLVFVCVKIISNVMSTTFWISVPLLPAKLIRYNEVSFSLEGHIWRLCDKGDISRRFYWQLDSWMPPYWVLQLTGRWVRLDWEVSNQSTITEFFKF